MQKKTPARSQVPVNKSRVISQKQNSRNFVATKFTVIELHSQAEVTYERKTSKKVHSLHDLQEVQRSRVTHVNNNLMNVKKGLNKKMESGIQIRFLG